MDIKQGNSKIRTLLIPSVADRILQTALHKALQPRLEAELETCSFAYREGLSHHDAVQEEFRFLIDRMVLRLLNQQVLKRSDFFKTENTDEKPACYLTPKARKIFIRTFEELMQTTLKHPILNRKVTYRQAVDIQAQFLLRTIEQEEEYIPFSFPK